MHIGQEHGADLRSEETSQLPQLLLVLGPLSGSISSRLSIERVHCVYFSICGVFFFFTFKHRYPHYRNVIKVNHLILSIIVVCIWFEVDVEVIAFLMGSGTY